VGALDWIRGQRRVRVVNGGGGGSPESTRRSSLTGVSPERRISMQGKGGDGGGDRRPC